MKNKSTTEHVLGNSTAQSEEAGFYPANPEAVSRCHMMQLAKSEKVNPWIYGFEFKVLPE